MKQLVLILFSFKGAAKRLRQSARSFVIIIITLSHCQTCNRYYETGSSHCVVGPSRLLLLFVHVLEYVFGILPELILVAHFLVSFLL